LASGHPTVTDEPPSAKIYPP